MSRLKLVVACMALFGLSACGESDQVLTYKQGKYQGKTDTRAYENEPLAYGDAKWTKGDRASWESQIRTRNQAQNEYRRAP
jgi:hypothetical protein